MTSKLCPSCGGRGLVQTADAASGEKITVSRCLLCQGKGRVRAEVAEQAEAVAPDRRAERLDLAAMFVRALIESAEVDLGAELAEIADDVRVAAFAGVAIADELLRLIDSPDPLSTPQAVSAEGEAG